MPPDMQKLQLNVSTVPRILFLSPYKPYPKTTVKEDNVDFFYYRNTLDQKLFQLRQMTSWHPLHFLAQNLPVDSVVLENPTWTRFQKELRKGNYDVVCFTFTVISTDRILKMMQWIRAEAFTCDLIVGGYGTAIFEESLGMEAEIEALADHICTGEGLSFMRNYLREHWQIEPLQGRLSQNFIPTRMSLFRTRLPLFKHLNFVYALGCNYRCSFCATSAQYGGKKIEIVSAHELYDTIVQEADRYPRIQAGVIFEENFLADRHRILEFIELMKTNKDLQERPFHLTIFTSLSSLRKYSIEELLHCGIGVIFIGVESFRQDILAEEHLIKRQGDDIGEVFDTLHSVGIQTMGSAIVGWDSHTLENITSELDSFVQLNPTLYQVIPLQAVPGTELWNRMKASGRMNQDFKYETIRIDRPTFSYKNFSHDEVSDQIFDTYRKLVEAGGPWPFRMYENYLQGSQNLSNSKDSLLRIRARAYARMRRQVLPLAFISILLFGGTGFRRRWHKSIKLAIKVTPLEFLAGAIIGVLLLPLLAMYTGYGQLLHYLSPVGDQPDTIRKEYYLSKRGAE